MVRLSAETDETTSPDRQRAIIQASADARGRTIVGWAEDLDVSASKIHPLKRPELGKWLAHPEDFDEFIFWRIDRFVRGAADLANMICWSNEHGEGLASATETFDLRDPLGEAMAYLAAIFGKMAPGGAPPGGLAGVPGLPAGQRLPRGLALYVVL